MKKHKSKSRKIHGKSNSKTSGQGNSTAGSRPAQGSSAAQAPAPKWRPVFGQSLPKGFVPPNYENSQAAAGKAGNDKSATRQLAEKIRQTPVTQPALKNTVKDSAPIKLNPATLPQYFAKMDPLERILLAYVIYKQPKGWQPESFYSYEPDSLRYLDDDLPGPGYPEIAKVLTKWTKAGILSMERRNGPLSLADGVAPVFWQWLAKKAVPFVRGIEPQKIYAADLPGTMDNILNFLLWVERGEILVTRNNEINKHSLKRVMAAISVPVLYPELIANEWYFFWLVDVAQDLRLVRPHNGLIEMTTAGRDIPQQADVASILSRICPVILRSIDNKGFFLILPLFHLCTKWTSWSKLVTDLISPAPDLGNLRRLDRVISFLDPLRFLGLIDWGTYEKDVLFRVTPLGEKVFLNLVEGTPPDRYLDELKPLAETVYPMSGPDTAYVQPNFEIMMPRSASWTARWQLGQFAVLEQQDQMLKYRLDKTYLLDALKRGFPAGEVLTTLSRLSPYPLPENLELTLREWVESFGQVTIMQLVLMECASAEQAATIASARKYRDYIYGLYNPTTVIVREPEKLRKLLEKQGIYPFPGILTGQEVAKRKGFELTISPE